MDAQGDGADSTTNALEPELAPAAAEHVTRLGAPIRLR
jgi:hypothetical protein